MIKVTKGDGVFLLIAVASAGLCYEIGGEEAIFAALDRVQDLFLTILPQLGAGLLIGGLIQQLVNRDEVARTLGQESGMRGLSIACVAGMLTPGGPFTSFPLVYALWVAGADAGALIAYIAAWSLIGINRLIIWELPFLGLDFTLLRFAASLPLPIIAGLLARRLARAPALQMREAPKA